MFHLFSRPIKDAETSGQEVLVVREIPSGCSGGQIRFAGSYWRARTRDANPIKAGDTALVLGRESTTMWVTKAY